MSWETCSSNASQKSVDSDTTFCEELEKSNRSLRKRNFLKYSQRPFNSQTQLKRLSLTNKMDENINYKHLLENCVFKIRNHLRKIRIMSINEIQSLVSDVNKINTPNREGKAMKGKVLSQLTSLFEETTEIEQRFSYLNLSNTQAINIFQDSCSKCYQHVAVNDTENTITSNNTNGEQLENCFSYDFVNNSEVSINQFPNFTHSSSIDGIQKDLKKLKEIENFKNQDPTKKYEEILKKSSTVSFSFDENMLSNINFKTPSIEASLYTQIESDDVIMDCTKSEKSNICLNNNPISQAKEDNSNFLLNHVSSEDIIPSTLIGNNRKTVQEKFMLPNKNIPSDGTSCDRVSQNTIPSTFTKGLFISQELKVDNLTNTICDSNEAYYTKNSYFKTQICNSEQSFPIKTLTNNLFQTPSVNLCESFQVSNKFDERLKFCSHEDLKSYHNNYSKVTMLALPFSDENNVNSALKLESNTEPKSKYVTSPILKKKINYKTQKYRYTKYSRKYKTKTIPNKVKRLKSPNSHLNNINILQQVCVVPSPIKMDSQVQQFDDIKEFSTVKEIENTQRLNLNLTDNENGSAVDDDNLKFTANENSICSNSAEKSELQTLKGVIERIDKFKQEFANWILQTAMDEYSRKSYNVTQNIPEKKDITDLIFQLTAQEKIQNYSKINEIANLYRDKVRIEGLPKFEEFSSNPFCVDFNEIDKKYQQ